MAPADKRKNMDSSPHKGAAEVIMCNVSEGTTDFLASFDSGLAVVADAGTWQTFQTALVGFMKQTVRPHYETMASQISDLCKEVADLRNQKVMEQVKEIKMVERVERIEMDRKAALVKAARGEMAAKMETAMAHVKILDLDFG